MSLTISFRNVDSSEAIKEHCQQKVEKLEKLVKYNVDFHIMIGQEHLVHDVEITCHFEKLDFAAQAKTENLYEAIDTAVHKLDVQLKKERDRKKGHHTAHQAARPAALKLGQDVQAEIPHREKKTEP